MVKETAHSSTNSTRSLYDAPSKPEQKVKLTTTIIVSAITMAIGVLVGINFDQIHKTVNTALGQKTADAIDLSSLNDLYKELSINFNGTLDKTKILEETKRGLVNGAGDKYTYYMTATEADDFNK